MRSRLGHKMILASAGSGKTFTLVNRFIELLAVGVNPSRIQALTFTRKAAGEFLQQIFLRLMKAASDEQAASELSGRIGQDGQTATFYKSLLIRLVHEMGSLQLGTIDSFFARIVGGFPYELGLSRPHRILDEFETGRALEEALDRFLSGDDKERSSLILQLYKDLTWGTEGKLVYGLFHDKFKSCHTVYLENRDSSLWGAASRIYRTAPWWMGEGGDLPRLTEAIREELSRVEMKPSTLDAFERLLDAFSLWQPGQPLNGGKLLDELLRCREGLSCGGATITYRRVSTDLTPPLSQMLFELLQIHVRQEIARCLLTTESLGGLLREFDHLYDRYVREGGSLVFADLPMLLVKGLCDEEKVFRTEDLVYRLDGQTDHWLIDEFQDTSRIQWKVLSAFVDEILQDASGERSFFYVGDVKQSIYGWRGGDSRLFDEIARRYNQGGTTVIESASLDKSWRSAPPVIDFVNTLFGSGIESSPVGPQVSERWRRHWRAHEVSSLTASLDGYAAWGLVADGSSLEEACVDLLIRTRPLERGLSCAILMKTNKDVVTMTRSLRQSGIPASMEGVVQIAMDTIMGTWIRAFFYSLVSPDEVFPKAYLSLPGPALEEETYRRLARKVRLAVSYEGYAEAVRLLLGFLFRHLDPDPFLARRGEQLLEATTRFDEAGAHSFDKFIAYLESATVQEATLSTQIQVMTVHKAKGLDFDQVIVAGFGGDSLVRPNYKDLHIQRGEAGEVEWILDLPVKGVRDHDPVLREASESAAREGVFESLCQLYVAVTRARQGVFCVAEKPVRTNQPPTWQGLFETAFHRGQEARAEGLIEWQDERGNGDWQDRSGVKAVKPSPPLRLSAVRGNLPPVRPMLRRMHSPSQESHPRDEPVRVLRPTEGRRFGSCMHDTLATLEWIDFSSDEALDTIVERAPHLIRERLRAFLKSDLAREVFGAPMTDCELWREKPYVLRRQSTVTTGIIDRAVIYLGSSGEPVRALVLDFKTDALDPSRPAKEQLLERYALQVDRYREAVALLTGLPEESIATQLVPV